MIKPASVTLAATLSLFLAACSSATDNPEPTPDLSATADLGLDPAPDLAPVVCSLPFEHRPIDTVSTSAVTINPDGTGFTAEIDARAGGGSESQKNPYVYLDLVAGKKVDITDVQAQKSTAWDIAFKRWQVKINSGDSGSGGVKAALIPPTTELPQVTTAPASGYVEDHYFDAKCRLELDGNGGPKTALSTWYDYNINTHVLTPWKQVYVLTRRDGKGTVKLQVMGYYKAGASGIFTVRWGFLP